MSTTAGASAKVKGLIFVTLISPDNFLIWVLCAASRLSRDDPDKVWLGQTPTVSCFSLFIAFIVHTQFGFATLPRMHIWGIWGFERFCLTANRKLRGTLRSSFCHHVVWSSFFLPLDANNCSKNKKPRACSVPVVEGLGFVQLKIL
jgi:hypothetical protein